MLTKDFCQLAEIQLRLQSAQANVERQQLRVSELTADMGSFAAATYRAGGLDPTLNALLAADPAESRVVPMHETEFVCRRCFLVKHRSQLADKKRTLCRDCA